jgi:hypothetical protein
LDGVASLSGLTELRELMLVDLFGFGAEQFPEPRELPRLRVLVLNSVAKELGAALKKRYAGLERLELTKPRSPGWLEQNLDNPFRSWDGRRNVRPADAKAVFSAYLRAKKSIEALALREHAPNDVESVLESFMRALNAAATKSALGTLEMHEASRAFQSLLGRARVPAEVGGAWWEAWEAFRTIHDTWRAL